MPKNRRKRIVTAAVTVGVSLLALAGVTVTEAEASAVVEATLALTAAGGSLYAVAQRVLGRVEDEADVGADRPKESE